MDNLWAPWRVSYITQKKSKACVFCKIEKSKKDKENLIVFRSSFCFAVINTYPYNNGHLMVIPNRHIANFEKLSSAEVTDMMATTKKMLAALKKTIKPQGFNVGMNLGVAAGAGIAEHLHMHIVPRWSGDTNLMPVVANTKVISQSLQELYRIVTKCLQKKK